MNLQRTLSEHHWYGAIDYLGISGEQSIVVGEVFEPDRSKWVYELQRPDVQSTLLIRKTTKYDPSGEIVHVNISKDAMPDAYMRLSHL